MSAYATSLKESSKEALLEEALRQHDRADKAEAALKAVREAVDYAGNRWSEWGERAVTVAEMLDAALEVK